MSPDAIPSPHQIPDQSAAQPDHARLDLEHFLPYRLSVLSNRVSQTISGLYRQRFGLGVTEWRTMAVLGRYPDLSASEVAERTAMDKVAVSRAVARLLQRGFIQRHTHGDDRRRSVLALSEAGYAVYDQVAPMTLECERQLLNELDADERAQLDALLHKLSAGVGLIVGHD
ncbi:MAG: MarR family winged helix-turn-helix transcriptional regulator [Pseudoxanthomonas sp.]|nr:MarR family winged helix-turn-helix transcriptional regulator [Pseudoxanthomonas sp.]